MTIIEGLCYLLVTVVVAALWRARGDVPAVARRRARRARIEQMQRVTASMRRMGTVFVELGVSAERTVATFRKLGDALVIHTMDKTRDEWKRDMFRHIYGDGPMPTIDYRDVPRDSL